MAFRNRNKQPAKPTGNAAFIDSQNLNLGIQKVGWKMDWRKFREYLRSVHNVTDAYMFVGYIPENEDMYLQLHEAGYRIVLKPLSDLSRPEDATTNSNKDAKDKKPIKGNIDAELVLWAMKEYNNYDKAIIVSGDSDFYCLLEYFEEKSKLAKVLVPNWQYAKMFNKYEEYIIRLDQMKAELAYRHGMRPRRNTAKSAPQGSRK